MIVQTSDAIALLVALFTFLTAVVGVLSKVIYDRFKSHAEQLESLRVEASAQRREHQKQIEELNTKIDDAKKVDMVKDDYIGDLRQHIWDQLPPPPPDWPSELTRRR